MRPLGIRGLCRIDSVAALHWLTSRPMLTSLLITFDVGRRSQRYSPLFVVSLLLYLYESCIYPCPRYLKESFTDLFGIRLLSHSDTLARVFLVFPSLCQHDANSPNTAPLLV